MNFPSLTQIQLINILSKKCFKEIYFHKITKRFGNNKLFLIKIPKYLFSKLETLV